MVGIRPPPRLGTPRQPATMAIIPGEEVGGIGSVHRCTEGLRGTGDAYRRAGTLPARPGLNQDSALAALPRTDRVHGKRELMLKPDIPRRAVLTKNRAVRGLPALLRDRGNGSGTGNGRPAAAAGGP